ncbi:Wzz/FepE/Etk N-terminal domain-containing protein [Deinococcus pimensis]|uniref:Wzz/FepE/Etk N-terminal domain-containing protein n=1 Tax=Deinococcus pimensis TaxID=309888 RepID=UPI0004891AF6|nr:Wzz/FepE/Etk N-terminal domain-containing protein [Deinococcus pimensis]
MEEELSLRDIADVLGRYRTLLIVTPLLLAAAAVGAVSVLPKTYTAETIVAVNASAAVQTPGGQNGPPNGARSVVVDPARLPNAASLASGFTAAAPDLLSDAWNTTPENVPSALAVTKEDSSSTVTIRASASTPAQAQTRAALAADRFGKYVGSIVGRTITKEYRAALQDVQLDVNSNRATLATLRERLGDTPQILQGRGQPSGRTAAAGAGLDARFTGSSDQPTNPAYAVLAVRIAEVETALADNEAFAGRLRAVLSDAAGLSALAGRYVQPTLLASPQRPVRPDGPGRAVVAVIALLLGLFLATLLAFVLNALRRPAPTNANGRLPVGVRQGD